MGDHVDGGNAAECATGPKGGHRGGVSEVYRPEMTPEQACVPALKAAGFDRPNVRWNMLEETDDGYDLYGDGVIRMHRTPGHAPGQDPEAWARFRQTPGFYA